MLTPTAPAVAVVEDDEQMRQAMRRVLEMAGYMTTLFDSAETFLESGAACRVSCVVLDIRLPGISGLELHRRLRSAGNRVPTIFVTAYDDWRDRGLTLKGTDACLVKPFPAETLIQAVTRTFEKSDAPNP
jgi:FixJ family two-component response regulator